MLPSNLEMRKKYLCMLEEIQKDELFIELMEMLNSYNFSLKLEHDIIYQRLEDEDGISNEDIFSDSTVLCYLYDYVILDEVGWRNKLKKSNFVLSAKERAEKFFELSQKLIFLYRKELFDKLEKEIFDTQDIIEIKWANSSALSEENILQMIGCGPFDWPEIIYNNIVFSIDGINIFKLGGNRYFTEDDIELFIKDVSDKNYFINRIRSSTDLVNIADLECYSGLSARSKKLIDSGNQYLDLVFSERAAQIKDYSPLLLNFSKTLEIEIKEYFNTNFSLIWPLADLVNANSGLLLNTSSNKKYRIQGLIGICKEISRFKEQFHPSGHKSLPYILHYLGLGKEIEENIGLKGFLEGDERDKVLKENIIIERLFDTSNNRNKYVHELVIESKNEFLLYYTDIIQALTLIESIK